MKRFWSSFFIALIVLVAGFFITSVSMASYNNHSLTDEWHSWLPAQEKVEDEVPDDDVSIELPAEEVSTEVEDDIVVE